MENSNKSQFLEKSEKVVFVSYAWGGESERIVNKLEQALSNHGIRIVRDKKDLGYKGSIKEFEKRMGQGDCIVLVISDKYLRSEHCMYELVEIGENPEFRNRAFPIVLSDAGIYKAIERIKYINYWDNQISNLNQEIKKIALMNNLEGVHADLDKYTRIRHRIDHLLDLLSDMNALTPDEHESTGFSSLINDIERSMNDRFIISNRDFTANDSLDDEDKYSRQCRISVFLNHASEDKALVRKLYKELKKYSWIEPWLDEEKLLPGQDWDFEIAKAIQNSDAFITCLSRNSVEKIGVVQEEIHKAERQQSRRPTGWIYIIPILLDDCEVPYNFGKYHWVKIFETGGFEKLIKSLEKNYQIKCKKKLTR